MPSPHFCKNFYLTPAQKLFIAVTHRHTKVKCCPMHPEKKQKIVDIDQTLDRLIENAELLKVIHLHDDLWVEKAMLEKTHESLIFHLDYLEQQMQKKPLNKAELGEKRVHLVKEKSKKLTRIQSKIFECNATTQDLAKSTLKRLSKQMDKEKQARVRENRKKRLAVVTLPQ